MCYHKVDSISTHQLSAPYQYMCLCKVPLLRTVKAAYIHINYAPIKFLHGEFNFKYLMDPWQYERGVCNNDNNDASQFCKGKQSIVMVAK